MGLVRKRDGYYFRGYVPKDLYGILGRKTQDKKLYTNNKKDALKLIKKVKIEFNYEIYIRHSEMAKLDKKSVIRSRIDDYVNKELKDREESLHTIENLNDIFDYIYDICIERIKAYENAILDGSYSIITHKYGTLDIDKLLIDILNIKLETEEMYYAQAYCVEALLNLEKTIKQKLLNTQHSTDYEAIQHTQVLESLPIISVKENTDAQALQSTTTVLKEKVIRDEESLKFTYKKFLEKTFLDGKVARYTEKLLNRVLSSLIIYFKGDINIHNITLDDMLQYRSTLEKLPKYWTKNNSNDNNLITFDEIIEKSNSSKSQPELLSISTIQDKYIGTLNRYFKFLNLYTKGEFVNFAVSLNYNKEKYTAAKQEIVEYTNEELEEMFNSPYYTKKLTYNITNKIEYAFAPIFSLYSTMRLNELSSLYIEDIKKVDDVYFFDINDKKDKTIKKLKSKRFIPIHNKIIEAGFLIYIEYIKKQGVSRVWPNLKIQLKYDKECQTNC